MAWWRVPALPGPWGVPDGLLVVLLAWILTRRMAISAPAVLGTGAGLGALKDLAGSGPFGAWLAIFAVTAWLAARADRAIARDHPLAQGVWLAMCAFGTTVAYAGLLGCRGEGQMALALVVYFGIPSAVATALGGVLAWPSLRWVLAFR